MNLLNYRFSKLGDYLGSKQIPYSSNKEIATSKSLMFEFEPISIYTCKKFLKELDPCKPVGPSEIPAWALKDSISTIAEPLCFLINAFLDEGRFPNECKRADVCPVFKKGDTEDPSNYRPISITAAISKIFEKVIREQIMEYLNKNKLLSQVQFGFRKNFSATDALVNAMEKIREEIDCNQIVTAAFLELSKAFDSISHEILLEKLKELHFDKKAVSLIESFLIGRTQRVVLSTSTSDWINLYQGVPQGTVLGPLLFNIYVNNMNNSIQSPLYLVQYADDTFLFVAAKDIATGVDYLQEGIKKLSDFFAIHRLNVNADKTEFIVFCESSKNSSMKNATLKVGDYLI